VGGREAKSTIIEEKEKIEASRLFEKKWGGRNTKGNEMGKVGGQKDIAKTEIGRTRPRARLSTVDGTDTSYRPTWVGEGSLRTLKNG